MAAAAGPKGRDASANTDATMRDGDSVLLPFTRTVAGISLEGSTLRPDNTANEKLYGKKVTATEIVAREPARCLLRRKTWSPCSTKVAEEPLRSRIAEVNLSAAPELRATNAVAPGRAHLRLGAWRAGSEAGHRDILTVLMFTGQAAASTIFRRKHFWLRKRSADLQQAPARNGIVRPRRKNLRRRLRTEREVTIDCPTDLRLTCWQRTRWDGVSSKSALSRSRMPSPDVVRCQQVAQSVGAIDGHLAFGPAIDRRRFFRHWPDNFTVPRGGLCMIGQIAFSAKSVFSGKIV